MELVKLMAQQHGFEHFGISELKKPLSIEFYKNWIDNQFHADMIYLKDHVELKENPQKLFSQAKTALVFAVPYFKQTTSFPLSNLKIASYAQDQDYHIWLKEKLQKLIVDLQKLFPSEEFVAFTDSSPVLERDLAFRAGLGWFGKNTCLIDKKIGSLFFIAEIYTSLGLQPQSKTSPDHCGTCDRCLTSCPTQALDTNKTLNPHLCISYWTIESKKIPPPELREKFEGWFFGCDICQTVCPWNIKIHDFVAPTPSTQDVASDLEFILKSSNKKLLKTFHGTPLVRAGGRGLKRNALIVAANLKIKDLLPLIKTFFQDEKLGELAQWSAKQLSSGQNN